MPEKNNNIIFGIMTLSFLVIFALMCMLAVQVNNLKEQLVFEKERINILYQNDMVISSKLESLETELNNFKVSTDTMMESNWESLARMRNNFIAFGNGLHLDEKDLASYYVKE
jgi:hypothetical protein